MKRADSMPWEGSGWVLTVDGVPLGGTMRRDDAERIARWLNDGGLKELEPLVLVGACARVAAMSKPLHADFAGE